MVGVAVVAKALGVGLSGALLVVLAVGEEETGAAVGAWVCVAPPPPLDSLHAPHVSRHCERQ